MLVEPNTRILGLASVARLAIFARYPKAAVLLTTQDRLELFQNIDVFDKATLAPDIHNWFDRYEKLIIPIEDLFKAFPANPDEYNFEFVLGQDYKREELLDNLLKLGFERDEVPGFVVKGDTVIIYFSLEDFLRLEFFGDELDKISHNEKELKSYLVNPLANVELSSETWNSKLLEHISGRFFLDSPELFEAALLPEHNEELNKFLSQQQVVSFGRDRLELKQVNSELETMGYYRAKLRDFHNDLELWLKDGYSVTLLLKFERTGRYLREKVIDDLESHFHNTVRHHPKELGLVLAPKARGGFRDFANKEIIITEDLLYGYQGIRKLSRLPGRSVSDAVQLGVGDYLIHPDHGVGKFIGLEPRQVLGTVRDYLIMSYAAEGKLYLPVELLPFLRRHPATTDDPPKLSTLGTNEWARAREKARVNAQELALELTKNYAKRQISKGISLPAVPNWDHLINDNCPFELTSDQAKAVHQVLADMEKAIPMERLISGDVGFGKTEVAIRAAHRAVGNGKQVAMLVPTTVLSQQHYQSFLERFKDLPVNIKMLSRFSSKPKAIIDGLADGSVDIIIATHRLLNDKIVFKDLGLFIIDEEHRFGVKQKEKIKALRANLDVLSLSATPIPRTLYMSLIGLRDVSQIMTPPEGRKPIQTVLQAYDPLAVREAIMFELERGGKIFYIHDRIASMGMRAKTLEQLVPEARIGVAHGQMDAKSLEEIMLGFAEGAFDVLLATTIVESGLDISGANTLVIERADRLGLAQLYQLRGRVGRRKTEAWAYLFYPGRMAENAQRRLYAIAELNDLGSGHLLAEKDMEIRGVGNLLGREQHGHISTISLEVYTEILAEEVAKLKGEERSPRRKITIDLEIDARLSPSYINDDAKRIEYYGRLAETESHLTISKITKEMREAYGPLPVEVKAFITLVKIRLLAYEKGVISIKEHLTDYQISFEKDDFNYDAAEIKNLAFKTEPSRYPPGFSIKKKSLGKTDILTALTKVLYLCE